MTGVAEGTGVGWIDTAAGEEGRSGRSLTVRVPVDLATYRSVAELGRVRGLTVEAAAGLLLSLAAAEHDPAIVEAAALAARWVVTPATYLQDGTGGGGTSPTRVRNLASESACDPAPMAGASGASPVGSSEVEVGRE